MSEQFLRQRSQPFFRALYHGVSVGVFVASFLGPFVHQGTAADSPEGMSQEEGLFQNIPSVHEASKYQLPVQGASKEEQAVTQAPSSITLITANEIKKYGYRTLADILQSVNGLFVTNDRNYSYLGIRGFGRPSDYNSRVLLLIDGHRLNENIYGSVYIGTEASVDVDLIDRIEIIRGPSSSLYGANAFFGVINILTKRGRDLQGPEISTELGSYESYKGRFTYGNRFANGVEVLFSGSFYDSAGHPRLFYKEFNDPATHNGIAKNADGDRLYHLFSKSSFSDFTLQGNYTYRKKTIPTGAYETVFGSGRDDTIDEHGYVDILYDHEFTPWFSLASHVYYDRYYYRAHSLYDYSAGETPEFALNQDVALGEWWGSEVKGTIRFFDKHRLTIGGEFRDNFTQNLKNFDIETYFNEKKRSNILAFYVQDEFSLLQSLQLNAGFRYDQYSSFGGAIHPRVALIYNLKTTTFKLLYGEAFRAPNTFELFLSEDEDNATPRLKPETIKSYEFIVEHLFGKHLRASAAGYYYTLDGLISQTTDPESGYILIHNAETIKAKGLEFELTGHWESDVEGRLSYAMQEAHNSKTGKTLTNSPHHMVKFSLMAPLFQDRLFVGLETRYQSERETLAGKQASGFFLTNLTLFGQHLIPGVEITGNINNLFDHHYSDPGSLEHRQDVIEQDGRTFWLKLKYGF